MMKPDLVIRSFSIVPGIGRARTLLTALARAGDPHVSRVLSTFLAAHDFGGGSGPEADAPGLAIWALTESAAYIADPVHDEWLWPHILRKTEWIERMLTARSPILESFSNPSPHNFNHGRQTKIASAGPTYS